jgi:hypothetical protein
MGGASFGGCVGGTRLGRDLIEEVAEDTNRLPDTVAVHV